MAEYIYSMVRARKAVGDKVILDDVTMAFLPGAKIGVVGPNGAGKSTILKIMAGLDTPSNGEAQAQPRATRVGILMQEPELDETKTVLENVQEGVGPIKAKVDRFNEISLAMAEPDADFDALLAEMGTLQEDDRRRRRVGPRLPARAGDGRAAHARPATSRSSRTSPAVRSAASRSASCCCRSPTCCSSTSPPTTSTPRACSGSSSTSRSTPAPCSPSPTTGTSSTTSPSGSAEVDRGRLYRYEGNYSTYLEKKGERLARPGQEGREARQAPRRRARVGALATRRAARPSRRRASRATRRWRPRPTARASSTSTRSRSRRARAWASIVIEAKKLKKGFDGRVAHRRPQLHAAAATASSASSARTASARPRCSRRSSASSRSTAAS